MRLQGAIFHLPDALLDASGAPLPGVKEFLSVMKMEGVWMYGVTDQSLEVCRCTLEGAGLASYFRGFMQAQEHGTGLDDPQLYHKAVKRLRTAPRATARTPPLCGQRRRSTCTWFLWGSPARTRERPIR